ncbi:hypothetical protein B4Q13_17820, partial [Lacticaseibacillus rhamnosus]
ARRAHHRHAAAGRRCTVHVHLADHGAALGPGQACGADRHAIGHGQRGADLEIVLGAVAIGVGGRDLAVHQCQAEAGGVDVEGNRVDVGDGGEGRQIVGAGGVEPQRVDGAGLRRSVDRLAGLSLRWTRTRDGTALGVRRLLVVDAVEEADEARVRVVVLVVGEVQVRADAAHGLAVLEGEKMLGLADLEEGAGPGIEQLAQVVHDGRNPVRVARVDVELDLDEGVQVLVGGSGNDFDGHAISWG